MPRNLYLFLPVITVLLLSSGITPAQKPANTATVPAGAKIKRPNVKATIGKYTGKTSIAVEEAKQLVSEPIKILDDKNVAYTISSYQFAYKRIGITEDEETGKTSPQSDIAADRFTTTPLPPVWQKNITDGLHSGEELYFFDIIVFDKQGRRFFAPEIQLTIR